jgi:accessory gene regulator protein AgrB
MTLSDRWDGQYPVFHVRAGFYISARPRKFQSTLESPPFTFLNIKQGEIILTENIADGISRYFILRGIAKEDDREVLAYVWFQIFASIQQLLLLTFVALALNAFPQTIAFTLFFCALKRYSGGAHANRHWSCLTIFTGLTAAVCLMCRLVVLPPYIAIGASAITLALVTLKAPVIHPNNPKPPRVRKKMRKISISIALFQCALIVVGCIFWPMVALPGALGGLAAAIALLPPMPKSET